MHQITEYPSWIFCPILPSTLAAWKILLFPLCKLCRAWTAVHHACFSAQKVAKPLMLSCKHLWQVEMLILRRGLCSSCSAKNNTLLMCLFLALWLVKYSQEHHQCTVVFVTNFWSWLLLNRCKLHPVWTARRKKKNNTLRSRLLWQLPLTSMATNT